MSMPQNLDVSTVIMFGPQWTPLTKASDAEFDVLFHQRLNKQLSKQSWHRWFETPSRSLWSRCNTRIGMNKIAAT